MTWAPLETQKTIYGILEADPALRTLLGATAASPKIFDHVPDNTPYPYVTLQALPWEDRSSHTDRGWANLYQINTWYAPPAGRGNKEVQLIQKRIDELLHEQDICIDDWNTIMCRNVFTDILTEDDNVTKHGIQRFKLFLGGI